MGTLTVAMFMTLDGYTETSDGDLISPDWSDDMQQYWSGANAHDGQLLLYGRTAFKFNASYWPTADTEQNGDEYRAFARTMNRLPKVVVSNTLKAPGWNATVESGPLDEAVTRIKQQHEGEIVAVGGISLISALIGTRLVDHYRLLIMPRFAGGGRSIFHNGGPGESLRLIDTRQMDTGALLLNYDVASN
ncbi:dihydrofolate reductase family protein [Leifsonia sp. 2MCAF36]|uniref:dihydrofolate reductase family protein n=1 Tax=Leifsonia sp. 2MCAF36 TaxID=3232988 RepID=UPI003F96D633